MESRSTNDEHVIARQQKIVRDWNSMSVEKMMSNMVDKGLSYDDYGMARADCLNSALILSFLFSHTPTRNVQADDDASLHSPF